MPLRISVIKLLVASPATTSVPCEHPAALCSKAAGRPVIKGQQSGRARQLAFDAVPPRYGFAVLKPGRYSSRPCRSPASHSLRRYRTRPLRSRVRRLRSFACLRPAKPSGQPGHGRPGRWRRLCQSSRRKFLTVGPALPACCQPQTARLHRFPTLNPLGRSGPGRGGRLPSHIVGLFRCSREPEVSLLRRSRARRPHTARPPPRPRSASLRALGHWESLRRASASRSVLTPTASPAPPSRPRDSQRPRPTRGTTPEPQC